MASITSVPAVGDVFVVVILHTGFRPDCDQLTAKQNCCEQEIRIELCHLQAVMLIVFYQWGMLVASSLGQCSRAADLHDSRHEQQLACAVSGVSQGHPAIGGMLKTDNFWKHSLHSLHTFVPRQLTIPCCVFSIGALDKLYEYLSLVLCGFCIQLYSGYCIHSLFVHSVLFD